MVRLKNVNKTRENDNSKFLIFISVNRKAFRKSFTLTCKNSSNRHSLNYPLTPSRKSLTPFLTFSSKLNSSVILKIYTKSKSSSRPKIINTSAKSHKNATFTAARKRPTIAWLSFRSKKLAPRIIKAFTYLWTWPLPSKRTSENISCSKTGKSWIKFTSKMKKAKADSSCLNIILLKATSEISWKNSLNSTKKFLTLKCSKSVKISLSL